MGTSNLLRQICLVVLILAPAVARAIDYAGPEYHYYDVSGSATEIAEEMHRKGKDGHFAYTDYRIDYRFRTMPSPKGCAVNWVEVKLQVTIRMPRLVEGGAEVRQRWSAFEPALRRHELGHEAIGVAAAREIDAALWSVRDQPTCSVADSLATRMANDVLASLKMRDESYDSKTDHGKAQGAIFP